MARVRQILFVPPAPIVWAEHLGLFAKQGLDVETTQTLSSDQLGQGLADGTWDVGVGVVDNVIAWNAERRAGLQIMAQLERSTIMAFCCVPAYASLADAARELIAVDSTTNGFVLVLYRALSKARIDWRKCRYEPVGGVKHRFDALAAGNAAATILVPPFIDMATAQGFKVLWRGADIAPAYPGVVVTARRKWLEEHRSTAEGYLRALVEANAWAMHPANAEAAAQALIAARYAAPAAQRLITDAVPGLVVAQAGWDEVVALRRECGLLPTPEPEGAAIIDRALLAAASL